MNDLARLRYHVKFGITAVQKYDIFLVIAVSDMLHDMFSGILSKCPRDVINMSFVSLSYFWSWYIAQWKRSIFILRTRGGKRSPVHRNHFVEVVPIYNSVPGVAAMTWRWKRFSTEISAATRSSYAILSFALAVCQLEPIFQHGPARSVWQFCRSCVCRGPLWPCVWRMFASRRLPAHWRDRVQNDGGFNDFSILFGFMVAGFVVVGSSGWQNKNKLNGFVHVDLFTCSFNVAEHRAYWHQFVQPLTYAY